MANTMTKFDLEPTTQDQVDASVAKLTASAALQLLCYYVLCGGDNLVLRYEDTKEETPNGMWLRTLTRRVINDQGMDPTYFTLPPGAPS